MSLRGAVVARSKDVSQGAEEANRCGDEGREMDGAFEPVEILEEVSCWDARQGDEARGDKDAREK